MPLALAMACSSFDAGKDAPTSEDASAADGPAKMDAAVSEASTFDVAIAADADAGATDADPSVIISDDFDVPSQLCGPTHRES